MGNRPKNGSHQRFWPIAASIALLLAGITARPASACTMIPLIGLPSESPSSPESPSSIGTPATSGALATAGVLTTPRPVLKWRALAGANPPYRVMLEAREPEGRVLHAEDVLTANTELIPAQALAQTRASVKVLVSAGCAELTPRDVAAQAAAFHIDVRAACGSAASLIFDAATRRLTWQSSAAQHELRVFDSAGVRLLESTVLAAAQWTAGAHIEPGALAAVRAQCGGMFGPFSFAVLR